MRTERITKSATIQAERKTIVLELVENHAGRCLRIREDRAGRRNCVIIPEIGLPDVARELQQMRA